MALRLSKLDFCNVNLVVFFRMIQTLLSSLVSIPRLLAIVQSVNDTRVKSFLLSCSTIVMVISWEKDLRGMICWADKKNLALWHLKHPFWKWYIILKWMPWNEGILKSPIFKSEQFHLSITAVLKLFTWNCWKVQPNYFFSKYSIQLSLKPGRKINGPTSTDLFASLEFCDCQH